MLNEVKNYYDVLGPKVAEAMKKRYFEAYYCSTAAEAVEKVLSLIPAEDSVAWGGSFTLDQLGIKDALHRRGQTIIDRDAVPAEKREETMRQAVAADTFLMSSNAITEDGQLFNIDGMGNRVVALCFGPRSVIVVAGMNKVVKDLDAAYSRVRNYVAPINAKRLGMNTPCAATGQCADCLGPQCICANMVTTRYSRPNGKIKVVLVGEELGF